MAAQFKLISINRMLQINFKWTVKGRLCLIVNCKEDNLFNQNLLFLISKNRQFRKNLQRLKMFSIILENRNNHNKKTRQLTMLLSKAGNLAYKWRTIFKTLTIQIFSVHSTRKGVQSLTRVILFKMNKILYIYSHKLLIKNNYKIIRL